MHAGLPYAQYVYEAILAPLGIQPIGPQYDPFLIQYKPVSSQQGHSLTQRAMCRPLPGLTPISGLTLTPVDTAKLLSALVREPEAERSLSAAGSYAQRNRSTTRDSGAAARAAGAGVGASGAVAAVGSGVSVWPALNKRMLTMLCELQGHAPLHVSHGCMQHQIPHMLHLFGCCISLDWNLGVERPNQQVPHSC